MMWFNSVGVTLVDLKAYSLSVPLSSARTVLQIL